MFDSVGLSLVSADQPESSDSCRRLSDPPRTRRLVEAAVAAGQTSEQIAECLNRAGFRCTAASYSTDLRSTWNLYAASIN